MLNLAVLLEDSARAVPDRVAVVCHDREFTYAEIDARANRVANALANYGIRPGDKVALACPNLYFFPVVYYGILKAGAAVVPLNILLKGREIAYHLADSDARVFFCFEGTKELPLGDEGYKGFTETDSCEKFVLLTLDDDAPSPYDDATTLHRFTDEEPDAFESVTTGETDTAVILYTSGTTGHPKGAELTHLNMLLNARLSDTMYPRRDADVHLITLPLFHSFGQTVQMNAAFYNRATIVLLPRFTPDAALALMDRYDVTVFAGVPTMYWALLHAPDIEKYDLEKISRNLRMCKSGGASLPVEVLKGFEERFQTKILEGYGLSETSPVACFNKYGTSKPGSIGFPVWGVEIRIVDENGHDVPPGELGELVIRGHCVMKGYYKKPEATAAAIRNGWFHTGDLGRRDAEGYIYISDRVKDMILRGGFNVYPREVEEFLMTHEAVSLCAVIGVPCEIHGEEVKAVVVKKAGKEVTETELIEFCKANMAGYKYPRTVEFRDSLPMTATGKILKRELR
ncbi:MAG: long-chain fatty acid--CoA ligase [Acidobacteria bacterium]|nr:long-chain fatty acid--CoA ligase [Acidobacteriota bacterium]